MLQPADKNENVGYATQKPEALVGRIVSAKATKAASSPTSVKAAAQRLPLAKKLNVKWIATDLGKFSIHTNPKRLIGVERQLKAKDRFIAPFQGSILAAMSVLTISASTATRGRNSNRSHSVRKKPISWP